jgi:hypothetical protein
MRLFVARKALEFSIAKSLMENRTKAVDLWPTVPIPQVLAANLWRHCLLHSRAQLQ